MNAPKCPSCGAVATNPAATHCMYCNAPLGQAVPHMQPFKPPQDYSGAGPAGPYGHTAAPYPPPSPYGAPPPNPYGAPPNPYGMPQNPYGMPPNPYGAQGGYQVQQFQQPGFVPQRSWWNNFGGSAWGTFTLIRLGIAFFVLFIVLVGSCISAISH